MNIDFEDCRSGACVNCGSSDTTPYAHENGWNLVKCCICGLLFVHPRPPDAAISAAHQIGMHRGSGVIDVRGRFNPSKVKRYHYRLATLFDTPPSSGIWLDVGCGHGEFLTAIARWQPYRWTGIGVEPNAYKRRKAQARGFDVRESLDEVHHSYPVVISLLNVFSHLPNPSTFLRRLLTMLPPGGELVLQTGDTAGFAARHHPRPLYLPDHLCFASKKIVIDMIQRSGFTVVCTEEFPLFELTIYEIMTEIIKSLLPGMRSRLQMLMHSWRYCKADLWVRARRD